ncbi:uncharacterized protein [Drosophila virilis]|uniref:uncharacterized protein n=1 Tax=Drosophila virilis TaxID=7244 RepID=UPI0038B3DAEA
MPIQHEHKQPSVNKRQHGTQNVVSNQDREQHQQQKNQKMQSNIANSTMTYSQVTSGRVNTGRMHNPAMQHLLKFQKKLQMEQEEERQKNQSGAANASNTTGASHHQQQQQKQQKNKQRQQKESQEPVNNAAIDALNSNMAAIMQMTTKLDQGMMQLDFTYPILAYPAALKGIHSTSNSIRRNSSRRHSTTPLFGHQQQPQNPQPLLWEQQNQQRCKNSSDGQLEPPVPPMVTQQQPQNPQSVLWGQPSMQQQPTAPTTPSSGHQQQPQNLQPRASSAAYGHQQQPQNLQPLLWEQQNQQQRSIRASSAAYGHQQQPQNPRSVLWGQLSTQQQPTASTTPSFGHQQQPQNLQPRLWGQQAQQRWSIGASNCLLWSPATPAKSAAERATAADDSRHAHLRLKREPQNAQSVPEYRQTQQHQSTASSLDSLGTKKQPLIDHPVLKGQQLLQQWDIVVKNGLPWPDRSDPKLSRMPSRTRSCTTRTN